MANSLIVQDYYPEVFHECFGCGPKNPEGLQLRTRLEDDRVVSDWMPDPRLRGAKNVLQGGVMSVLMDEVGGAAAFVEYHRMHDVPLGQLTGFDFATARLCVDYISPAFMDTMLHFEASIRESGGRKVWVECSATANDRAVAKGELLFLSIEPEQRQSR